MEDLATARISTAQTAQRLFHESRCEDTGRRHSPAKVKEILGAECADILGRLGDSSEPDLRTRYQYSFGIALQWIRNYTELDFRSLASYTRDGLQAIRRNLDTL
jgi:malate synthase